MATQIEESEEALDGVQISEDELPMDAQDIWPALNQIADEEPNRSVLSHIGHKD